MFMLEMGGYSVVERIILNRGYVFSYNSNIIYVFSSNKP